MAHSTTAYLFSVLLLIAGLLATIAAELRPGLIAWVALVCFALAVVSLVNGVLWAVRESRFERDAAGAAREPHAATEVRRAPDPEPRHPERQRP